VVHTAANQLFWCYNYVGKTLPQPQQQPNKTQKPTQTKNKTQNTNAQKACSHKTPTTTIKKKT
jgi:hypothetical protein